MPLSALIKPGDTPAVTASLGLFAIGLTEQTRLCRDCDEYVTLQMNLLE